MTTAAAAQEQGVTQPKAPAPVRTQLCCPVPTCRSTNLGTIERIAGTAPASMYRVEGAPDLDIDFRGDTEVHWDTSTTVGVICRSCAWASDTKDWAAALATVATDEDDE